MTASDDHTRVIAETFDQRAANYGKGNWHRVYAERLVQLAALEPRQSVLDAGAGTGFAAVAIARAVGPSGRVVAIDVSLGMLAEARTAIAAAGVTNVEVAEADATNLPQFDASTFDAVICAAALLYMPVGSALEEWHRVLKPGGLVGFSTMCAGSPRAGQLFRDCAQEFGVSLQDPSAALGSDDQAPARPALRRPAFSSGAEELGADRLYGTPALDRSRLARISAA